MDGCGRVDGVWTGCRRGVDWWTGCGRGCGRGVDGVLTGGARGCGRGVDGVWTGCGRVDGVCTGVWTKGGQSVKWCEGVSAAPRQSSRAQTTEASIGAPPAASQPRARARPGPRAPPRACRACRARRPRLGHLVCGGRVGRWAVSWVSGPGLGLGRMSVVWLRL